MKNCLKSFEKVLPRNIRIPDHERVNVRPMDRRGLADCIAPRTSHRQRAVNPFGALRSSLHRLQRNHLLLSVYRDLETIFGPSHSDSRS